MPEIDEHDADDQPELVVRRVAAPRTMAPGRAWMLLTRSPRRRRGHAVEA